MRGILVVGLAAFLGICSAQEFNVSAVLDKLVQGYDKRIRPNWGGSPVDVGVTMYVIGIYDISTKELSVKSDMFLRHTWVDPRLAFDAPQGLNSIRLGPDGAKNFWEPDTFIPDGTAKFAHDSNMFFKIYRDGSVLKSVRVFTKLRIALDLQYFPFDTQAFDISLESYGYNTKDIIYRWEKGFNSVGISPDTGSPEMSVIGTRQITRMIHLSTGNYSRLAVTFAMVRSSGYYVRHFYLPAVIAILFVWASFWFSPNMAVVRVLLVLCSFVTGGYLLAQLWDYIPQVGYPTMLEKYLVFGLIMSALAIGEFVLVVFLYNRVHQARVFEADSKTNKLSEGESKDPEQKQDGDAEDAKKNLSSYVMRSTRYLLTIHHRRRSYQKVDLFFRAAFPLICIIYNIWYWTAFP